MDVLKTSFRHQVTGSRWEINIEYRYRLFIHILAQNKQLILYWVQVLYGRNRDIREILRKSEWLIRGLETRKD